MGHLTPPKFFALSRACCLSCMLQATVIKWNAGLQTNNVRRDIVINIILTWCELNFLIGYFKFVV